MRSFSLFMHCFFMCSKIVFIDIVVDIPHVPETCSENMICICKWCKKIPSVSVICVVMLIKCLIVLHYYGFCLLISMNTFSKTITLLCSVMRFFVASTASHFVESQFLNITFCLKYLCYQFCFMSNISFCWLSESHFVANLLSKIRVPLGSKSPWQ